MLNQRFIERVPRSTESPTMIRYRLSKRLGVLVDYHDFLDLAGNDTTSARGEPRRTPNQRGTTCD
jgi:hypothetical protein